MMFGPWTGAIGAWGWAGMALMWVFWIGVIALLVWGVMALTRGSGRGDAPTPREILDRRLAHGEIDEAQYERLRTTLG